MLYCDQKIVIKDNVKNFSSYVFGISTLTFKSLIHFKLNFVYYVKYGFHFILLHVGIQFSQILYFPIVCS